MVFRNLSFYSLSIALITPFACRPPDLNSDDASSDTDGATGPGTSSTTSDPTASSTNSTTGCSAFICPEDMGPGIGDCDIWEQDCPEGEKCMPWANDGGGAWNSTRCSEIDSSPQPVGNSCMAEGSGVSGIDNCDIQAMCWDISMESGEGVCVGFCAGTRESPTCAESTTECVIANEGALNICLQSCSPLLAGADCERTGNLCSLNPNPNLAPGDSGFVCVLDASGDGGNEGDPCGAINGCSQGLACMNGQGIEGCTAGGCCTPFCDLSSPTADTDCQAAMGSSAYSCTPFFADGQAPPQHENLGICFIPV